MTVVDIGEGELIDATKPNQSGHAFAAQDFLPCLYSWGFYHRQVWKHTAKCCLKPQGDQSETKKKEGAGQF